MSFKCILLYLFFFWVVFTLLCQLSTSHASVIQFFYPRQLAKSPLIQDFLKISKFQTPLIWNSEMCVSGNSIWRTQEISCQNKGRVPSFPIIFAVISPWFPNDRNSAHKMPPYLSCQNTAVTRVMCVQVWAISYSQMFQPFIQHICAEAPCKKCQLKQTMLILEASVVYFGWKDLSRFFITVTMVTTLCSFCHQWSSKSCS